ncbi:MAG: penicillin acylase family protein [Balneolaceae bacterium]
MRTLISVALFLFILVSGFLITAAWWTFYEPLPDYNTTVELPGLSGPVDVHWDPYGVPHIYAENEHDLYYTVGYIHAQERIWQMTLFQISAEGKFAEFFGEEMLEIDKMQRTLGFHHMAEQIDAASPPEIRTVLEAYAAGVNDYTALNRRSLPIEFSLTGVEPIPWTPVHTHAISRLMAWDLNAGWWNNVTYGILRETLSEGIFTELMPEYESGIPYASESIAPEGAAEFLGYFSDLELEKRKNLHLSGTSGASNAWAVSGARSETGQPLLAGDPHMGLSMPGFWFEMHMHLNGQNLSGATIPGAPVVVVGQNDRLAWSLTTMMADETDFYVEIPAPDDPERYVADSLDGDATLMDFEIRNEIIRVRGEDDVLYPVRSTRNGPVISDIYPNRELLEDRLITMRWTGHEISQEILALFQVNRARDIDAFEDALRQFHVPGQNFVYADRDGNIARFSAARLPIRDHHPLQFRKGWDSGWGWNGWIPFEELPREINPPSGFVANSNNKLHEDGYPHYIGTFWAAPSRINRIEEYMAVYDTLSVDIFQQMQNDRVSPHARELAEIIIPILRGTEDGMDFSDILPYLENWDHSYNVNSTAATLMDRFLLSLTSNTLRNHLGDAAYNNFIRNESLPIVVMMRLLRDESFLFNQPGTGEVETRESIVRQSMKDTRDWLEDLYGTAPVQWRWGNLHTITLTPPLFAEAAADSGSSAITRMIVDNLMSSGPWPVSGHGMSLNKGEYRWHEPFEMVVGPSIRRIVDLSSMSRTWTVIPTGQSGNPLSEFYGDQTDMWLNGQYRYLYQDSTFFRDISYQTMRLHPR